MRRASILLLVAAVAQAKNAAVIVPSFNGHLDEFRRMITSYCNNVMDAHEVTVYAIVEEAVMPEFQLLSNHCHHLNLEVVNFKALLGRVGHAETDEAALIGKVGMVTYQTFKKLYSLFDLEYDVAVVLDSESQFIRPMHLKLEIAEFLNKPFVLTFPISKPENGLQTLSLDVSNQILGTSLVVHSGLTLADQWIYDKKIVQRFQQKVQRQLNAWVQPWLFSCVLYYTFVVANANEFGYRVIDSDERLASFGVSHHEHIWQVFTDGAAQALTLFYSELPLFMYTVQNSPPQENEARILDFVHKTKQIKILASTPTNSWLDRLQPWRY